MKTTPKWQRIRYMPQIPLGEGGRRVTGSAEHIALSRIAAQAGMVLLKNEKELLPLESGAKLAVFGKAQADYVKGGGGSGDVTAAYGRSLAAGLAVKEGEGKLSLFTPLTAFYEKDVREQYAAGAEPGRTKEPALPPQLLAQARAFTDTALITICRFSGEGYDRTGKAFDGDFFLSREEDAMVRAVLAAFPRAAVVLNIGGVMDTRWLREDTRVGAALLAWQGGMEGGLAAADILCGDVCPSGRLGDTFAVDFAAYPSSAGFAASEDFVEYTEDIYVGYRYFETIPGAAQKVCYPFGFGLSYTSFAFSGASVRFAPDDTFTVCATVTNTGKRAGQQVAQVYCAAPQGRLGKAARVLAGFAKTRLLAPGESEEVRMAFPAYALASYDDTGAVCRAAYVLEAGEYRFYLGENVRDAQPLDFIWSLPQARVLVQLRPECEPRHLTKRMLADGSYAPGTQEEKTGAAPWDRANVPFDGEYPAECPWKAPFGAWSKPTLPQLDEVYEGTRTLADFIAQLSPEQKIHLLGGQPNRGPANTFGFGNLPLFGVPDVMTADGPAGLRIQPEAGVCTTAWPCATLLACSWDTALAERVGAAAAAEVKENGFGVWLAPALNIHRSPLCGRNFEYYAEDPLLAGRMAAAMVRGIQSVGVAATVKHFACNNKETNRRQSDSRVSERALREIYLKAFEICVREAHPWALMSAYNLLNGVRTSENRELLTDILRGEWGFDGAVTSDWYTYGSQYREIAAGNDIKMACGMPVHTLQMLREGRVRMEDIDASAERVLRLLLRLA